MVPFEHFWQKAAFLLVHPKLVYDYTLDRREDGQFQAQYKDGDCIFCTAKDGTVMRISKREFRTMYSRWERYLSGDLSLKWEDETMFARYTASIIHQYLN